MIFYQYRKLIMSKHLTRAIKEQDERVVDILIDVGINFTFGLDIAIGFSWKFITNDVWDFCQKIVC